MRAAGVELAIPAAQRMSRPVIIPLRGRRADRLTYRWAPSLKPIASRLHAPPLSLRRLRALRAGANLVA